MPGGPCVRTGCSTRLRHVGVRGVEFGRHRFEAEVARALAASRLFGRDEHARLGRFEVLRRIGQGASGTVYLARDSSDRAPVALKVLSQIDGAGIYWLKREFRALSNVVHPNLVALHELVHVQGQWFFTMEFVDGVPFAEWVKPADAGLDETRLRSALRQLALGVSAVHAAGKLHCDLKPSNVLVTREGRVVVLDFGLVTERALDNLGASAHSGVVGTPAYMAPEQAAGDQPTEASDWYSFGVMLFEALVGRLPFEGHPLQVLKLKQQSNAPDPRAIDSAVPHDLSALCEGLLRRDVDQRLGAKDVAAVLGATDDAAFSPFQSAPAPCPVLLGRDEQLVALHEALERTRRRETVVLLFGGRSGMGKSALLEHFGHDAGASALVLSGRCHDQETVPYKVFDSVMDALSRHLRRLPSDQVKGLAPRHADALLRLFPVLSQAPALAEAARAGQATEDARELRNQGFAALKELLQRVTDRGALVLLVDDLQWGDIDSARMLAHLLGPPEPPSLLFVGAYRSDEAESSAFLREVLACHAGSQWSPQLQELGPLAAEAAAQLAWDLLGDEPPHSRRTNAESIATEARGVPFLVAELAQHHRARRAREDARSETRHISVEQVILERIASLPLDAQRLLQVISVAGLPIEQGVATQASELPSATVARCSRCGRFI